MNLTALNTRIFACALLAWTATSSFAGEAQGVLHWIDRTNLSLPVSGVVDEVSVSTGQVIKQGETLLKLDTRRVKAQLLAARSRLSRFKPGRDEAKRELDRAVELFDRTVLSEVELQRAKIDFAEKDAALQEARAEVTEAMLNLEYSELKAPIELVVLNIHVIKGQAVINRLRAIPLIEVARNQLAVSVSIAPSKLGSAKTGTQVTVSYAGKNLGGVISHVDYDIDKQRSVLNITLNNQDAVRGAVGHLVKVTWP
jgi:RND family efflux transporter MFP subunit